MNAATGQLFLRVWDDHRETIDGLPCLLIMEGHWGSTSRGGPERREQIRLMRDGAEAFGVVCVGKRLDGGGREIRSFDSENHIRFGRLIEKGDSVYATISRRSQRR